MAADLKQVVKEAFDGTSESFILVIEDATRLIRTEKDKVGNLEILGKLVKIDASGEALVCGDLHGDLESLIDLLQASDILRKMKHRSDAYMIFLGDYGDRGAFSAEVYWLVLTLKLLCPTQVILLRGNHEGPGDLLPVPHDLPAQLQNRFGEQWRLVYAKLRVLFDCFYNAVIVKERYLMLHGGLPTNASTIEDLASADNTNGTKKAALEELLWNDPNEDADESVSSPRGAGKLFSQKLTKKVLEKLDVNILVRGHEPCSEGFKISHQGKILTLFSRKGSPYFNNYGAYLDLPLNYKPKDAYELAPYVHKF